MAITPRAAREPSLCSYCRASLATVNEHVVPRKRGGPNDAMNILPACVSCNNSKSQRTPSEWRPDLPAVVYDVERAVLASMAETPRPYRVGRPSATGVTRSSPMLVRVTPDERATLERAAREAGEPLAAWVRDVALRAAKDAEP